MSAVVPSMRPARTDRRTPAMLRLPISAPEAEVAPTCTSLTTTLVTPPRLTISTLFAVTPLTLALELTIVSAFTLETLAVVTVLSLRSRKSDAVIPLARVPADVRLPALNWRDDAVNTPSFISARAS